MDVLQSSNQKYAEDLEGWHKWIGKKVCVSGTKPGILKYFGRTEFADGIWCGVELNEPVGKNNGSVKGIQYFTCKDNHGIFVSLNKVEKVQEKIWDRNSDGQKKLKNRRITLHSGPSQGKISSIMSDEGTHVAQSDKRRKTTFFRFPNDNVSRVSTTSNVQKPPLNNSYIISIKDTSTEEPVDVLNKTVILTEENVMNREDLHNVSTDKTYTENNSVLNATFDINHLQATELANNNNNKETVLDGTFILSDQNVESNEEQICDNASDRANSNVSKIDESLCILSLSQMKDFTICTEQFINDSNIKAQNLHLFDSCGNSKTTLSSENKPVSSSGLFQTDLKLCQDNSVLDDYVFLNNEAENGNDVPNRGAKRSSHESFPRHFSDDVKDICFEPARDQSSTPSEDSKQMFINRMSLIKSFNLDDSIKFETKRYSSSTPNKPAAPLGLLVEPRELMSKVDMPVLPVEDSLGNINLSLIDDQTLPRNPLDTAHSSEEEPLERRKSKFDDSLISDLVSHPVKAAAVLSTVCSEISNGRKSSSEATSKFDLQKMSTILSHPTNFLPGSAKQPVNANLNITQELSSDVKKSTVSESKTAVFETPAQNIEDMKSAQEGSSFQQDEIFLVSKMYSVCTKPINTTERISSIVKKDSDSDETHESVNGFPSSSSYHAKKLSSDSSNLNPQHCVPEVEKRSECDSLHQTFTCSSSYTIPLNNSYITAVNKNEDNAANGKMTAVSKASSGPECSVVIDQLHNMPQNESTPPAESSLSGKKEDCVLDTAQSLNATVCISGNINSHNLTFDVTENLETDNIGTNRSNVCANLTRQSVRDRNKIVSNAATLKSALVTNSSKPCVPNNKEQTVSNKPTDSVKQNNNVQPQKPLTRRYSAAPRIISQESKMQPKNQVVSKIDTNLKAARLSLPRQSLGPPCNAKKRTDSDSSVFKVPDSKAIKNALNYQRLRQDARKENGLDGSQKYPPGKRNVITPSGSENKSFILKENTQAVNVPVRNGENSLPAPSSRRSSIQSVSSQSSSKITTLNKNNVSKSAETKDFSSKNDQKLDASTRSQAVSVPPNSQKLNASRNQKLSDSANNQKSLASNAKEKQSLMANKKESPRVPGRLSECASMKRGIPRRSCLPKLKPVQQC